MDLKIFSDFYATLKQIATDIAGLKGLPEKERCRYRDLIDETFRLLDTALLLIITRLGHILNVADKPDEAEFWQELRGLGNEQDWLKLERDVRLCSNLRAASRQMAHLEDSLKGRLVVKDPQAFGRLVWQVLEGEGSLADFIQHLMADLAALGAGATTAPAAFETAQSKVRTAREALLEKRHQLITQQLEVFQIL